MYQESDLYNSEKRLTREYSTLFCASGPIEFSTFLRTNSSHDQQAQADPR